MTARTFRAASVDACDRCLALSQLMLPLCAVPVLRGTARHDALVARRATGDPDAAKSPQEAPIEGVLVVDSSTLAPTPGELVRAAHGATAERAVELGRRYAGWSADAVRARCVELGLAAVCACSTDYPPSLLQLSDPPPVLYVAGHLALLERCPGDATAIVGTRRPTRVGREASRQIATGIGQLGGIVVSGMALGVDGAAHDGALTARAPTIAVLASGADRPSPRSHTPLYDAIRERGAVVSELPPGTEPFKLSFPARNRIIAALSSAVIVVEAPLKSGALITVDHAHDLGVDVYAVPGSLASPSCAGSNRLLCEGAGGVVDGVEFMAVRRHVLQGPGAAAEPLRPAADDQALIHDLLAAGGPQSRQELGRGATSLPAGELEAVLVDLELSGWIDRGLDGRYRLVERKLPVRERASDPKVQAA